MLSLELQRVVAKAMYAAQRHQMPPALLYQKLLSGDSVYCG